MSLTSTFDHHHPQFTLIDHTSRQYNGDTCRMMMVDARNTSKARDDPCLANGKCVKDCAGYGRVCLFTAKRAADYACQEMDDMQGGSTLFAETDTLWETYTRKELLVGEKLGEGGFCNVNACSLLKNKKSQQQQQQQYAIKYLKLKSMVDPSHFRHGAADLAMEAHFLRVLQHPNIVQLHGVSPGPIHSAIASGEVCSFYIIIDRLVETLEQRIDRWSKQQKDHHSGLLFHPKQQQQQQHMLRIAPITLAIAKAMEYLHAQRIIFRDLKPDNIGFDANGNLKLFDFGLAKELKPSLLYRDNNNYKLTGNTGSRRYMAPEVAKHLAYNQSVDVYSFGILLWELCTLEKPFAGYSSAKHMQRVVQTGERPPLHTATTTAPALQRLMVQCWSPFPDTRPSYTAIVSTLLQQQQQQDTTTTTSSKRKTGGFGFLSPLSPRRLRHSSADSSSGERRKSAKAQPGGAPRSRSWGFVHTMTTV